VAGGGEQLTLNIAARYAEYTNFATSVDEFVHKSKVLRGHCDEVGTDYHAITRSSDFNIFCTETQAETDDKIAWLESQLRQYVAADRAKRQAEFYRRASGTPDRIISYLKEWETAGMTYAIVNFADAAYDASGVELFAREVIPAFA
jgi:alkanesulfonate monooxygenase SsuD/methylene tetrahydromethanopterin reductase-like flavin-dependent oxidoreductase (luciferase family)